MITIGFDLSTMQNFISTENNRIGKGHSVIEYPQNYIVLDIETTGFNPLIDEIIEFAAVKVSNGQIIDKYQTLVKPSREIDDFVIKFTGITNDMLVHAPSIDKVINDIKNFIGENLIVGHNVSFDVNFIYDAMKIVLNKQFQNNYLDTLRLSKKLFKDLPNYQLGTLANKFNKVNFPSHRAMKDVLATKELLDYILTYVEENNLDLQELFKKSSHYNPNKKRLNVKEIVATTDEINEDNPLFGVSVCFTGTLEKMLRKDALQLVANLGGTPMNSVTKETNLLVLGDIDYKDVLNGNKSNKYKKAEELILKGADLKIISETTFLDMIDDDLETKYYR